MCASLFVSAMSYLIFILITIALFAGFLALSIYEVQSGSKMFANGRARLDERVEHIEFVLTHVDFGSFFKEEMHRLAHYIAHISLQAVRFIERLLTNLVRYLRTKHAVDVVPRENAREFVRTLSDFKGHLEETRPKVPDIM